MAISITFMLLNWSRITARRTVVIKFVGPQIDADNLEIYGTCRG